MRQAEILDLSDETRGSRLFRPDRDDWAQNDWAQNDWAQNDWAWTTATVDPQACVLSPDAASLDEIAAMVEGIRRHPLPVLSRAPDQFEIPHLREMMARVRRRLDRPPGVAVIDALPLDGLDEEEASALFWVLAQLIGRPVAQKWDGTLLYHVRDTGQAHGYGVRGSYTDVELAFHIDNAFGRAPPDAVALLCLRPAAEGGVSRFYSLHGLHQRMLEAHPRLLARLYRPLLWDRQAEHAEGAPRVARAPMFACDGHRLRARVNLSLVRNGYRVAGEAMDGEAAEALAAFDALAEDPALWIELPLARGQVQFLNNRDVAHYRSHFTDHDDPALKRHLVRTWHRDWGAPSYDG